MSENIIVFVNKSYELSSPIENQLKHNNKEEVSKTQDNDRGRKVFHPKFIN